MTDVTLREVLVVVSIGVTILLLLSGERIIQFLLRRVSFVREVQLPVGVKVLLNPLRAVLVVLGIRIASTWLDSDAHDWIEWVQHSFNILLIAALTWLAIAIARVLEVAIIERYLESQDPSNASVRRWITQVSLLRRLIVAFLVTIAIAVALMTFGSFRAIGTGLLASAGIISVVVGIAAQSTLGNVFAGLHLAFSNIVKVNDVVVVAGETGQVDEITLTTVVVHIWNDRRLILPTSYFKENPFENWTRSGPRIGANIFFDVAFAAPIAELRDELQRYLPTHPLWDGRQGVLWVSDISGGRMRLRMAVSTASTDDIWALMNDVREHMVSFLVNSSPESILQFRGEGGFPA